MRQGDPQDPLLRQVLPLPRGAAGVAGLRRRPAATKRRARRAPGLLHKYQGRALLITTGACAVHCRYCFRRHLRLWADQADDQRALDSRARSTSRPTRDRGNHPERRRPAVAGQCAAGRSCCASSRAMPQLPASASTPARRSCCRRASMPDCCACAARGCATAGHRRARQPRRRNRRARSHARCSALRGSAHALLNQSVLLAGVNDDAATLAALSQRAVRCRRAALLPASAGSRWPAPRISP